MRHASALVVGLVLLSVSAGCTTPEPAPDLRGTEWTVRIPLAEAAWGSQAVPLDDSVVVLTPLENAILHVGRIGNDGAILGSWNLSLASHARQFTDLFAATFLPERGLLLVGESLAPGEPAGDLTPRGRILAVLIDVEAGKVLNVSVAHRDGVPAFYWFANVRGIAAEGRDVAVLTEILRTAAEGTPTRVVLRYDPATNSLTEGTALGLRSAFGLSTGLEGAVTYLRTEYDERHAPVRTFLGRLTPNGTATEEPLQGPGSEFPETMVPCGDAFLDVNLQRDSVVRRQGTSPLNWSVPFAWDEEVTSRGGPIPALGVLGLNATVVGDLPGKRRSFVADRALTLHVYDCGGRLLLDREAPLPQHNLTALSYSDAYDYRPSPRVGKTLLSHLAAGPWGSWVGVAALGARYDESQDKAGAHEPPGILVFRVLEPTAT